MKTKLPTKLAFVDVETTGSNPRGDRVMEIGVVRVEDGQVVRTLNTLINPLVPPPEFIVNMTGINPFDLENAPLFSEIIYELEDILADAVFVAHNARFDYAFVKNEFIRHDVAFSAKVLCTVRLARKVYPELQRFNLDSIVQTFGIVCEHRHRAYDDAHVLWDFYKVSQSNGRKKAFREAIAELLKGPSIPTQLDKKVLTSLHDGPGVYVFFGDTMSSLESGNGMASKDRTVLYVGKSINIRDRVRSHFSSDYQSSKDVKISQYINHIETIETAGELGALIREASMVKNMQPIYNRNLRRNQDMVVALMAEENGYSTIKLDRLRSVTLEMTESIIGVFRSMKQAKKYIADLCIAYSLCPKIMGLEKAKKSCFNYQLKRCKGACVGAETQLRYNLRFLEAIQARKVQRWPFSGIVAIEEDGFKRKETHLVNKWCYLGSLEYSGSDDPDVHTNEIRFDWDVYQILKKFVLKKRSDIKINEVKASDLELLKLEFSY